MRVCESQRFVTCSTNKVHNMICTMTNKSTKFVQSSFVLLVAVSDTKDSDGVFVVVVFTIDIQVGVKATASFASFELKAVCCRLVGWFRTVREQVVPS